MKKIILILALTVCANAANAQRATPLFSTTSDWEALTGMRYSLFNIQFGMDKSVTDRGLELFFLDSFPCIGEVGKTSTWLAPVNGTFEWDNSARLSVGCVYRPVELKFAFRKVRRGTPQGRAEGYFVCTTEVGGSTIQVRLDTCEERPFQ